MNSNHYFSLLNRVNLSYSGILKRNLIIVLSIRHPSILNSYLLSSSITNNYKHRNPITSNDRQLNFPFQLRQKSYSSQSKPYHTLHTSKVKMGIEEEEIRNEKRELRKQIRSKMKQLTTEEITSQSESVWKQLFDDIPQYKNAKSVGIFLSMPTGEIHTDTALHRIIQDGKELYVPRVGANFEEAEMDMVRVVYEDEDPHFHNKELFYKSWNKNKWGIPEPPHEKCTISQPGDIDLLLVPGVAFDKLGGRLGQGKGYYDRFIQRNNDSKDNSRMHLVAVGLTPQFLNDKEEKVVPMSEHDFRMNVLISPDFIWTVEN